MVLVNQIYLYLQPTYKPLKRPNTVLSYIYFYMYSCNWLISTMNLQVGFSRFRVQLVYSAFPGLKAYYSGGREEERSLYFGGEHTIVKRDQRTKKADKEHERDRRNPVEDRPSTRMMLSRRRTWAAESVRASKPEQQCSSNKKLRKARVRRLRSRRLRRLQAGRRGPQ